MIIEGTGLMFIWPNDFCISCRWRYGFRINALSLRNCWSRAVTPTRVTLSQVQQPCHLARQHFLQCGTFLPPPRALVCPPTATCLATHTGTPPHTRTPCRDHKWCDLLSGWPLGLPREALRTQDSPAFAKQPKRQAQRNCPWDLGSGSLLSSLFSLSLSLSPSYTLSFLLFLFSTPFIFLHFDFFPFFPPSLPFCNLLSSVT